MKKRIFMGFISLISALSFSSNVFAYEGTKTSDAMLNGENILINGSVKSDIPTLSFGGTVYIPLKSDYDDLGFYTGYDKKSGIIYIMDDDYLLETSENDPFYMAAEEYFESIDIDFVVDYENAKNGLTEYISSKGLDPEASPLVCIMYDMIKESWEDYTKAYENAMDSNNAATLYSVAMTYIVTKYGESDSYPEKVTLDELFAAQLITETMYENFRQADCEINIDAKTKNVNVKYENSVYPPEEETIIPEESEPRLKENIAVNAEYKNIKLNVNGKDVIPVDVSGNSTEPFIFGDTVYIPIRAVSTALECPISWIEDKRTVAVYLKDFAERYEYNR